MNTLLPERRPDKNGNIVTRWIRQFGKKRSAAQIPAPEQVLVPAQPVRLNQSEVTELHDLLAAASQSSGRALNTSKIELLADRDPETLKTITDAVKSSPDHAAYWATRLRGTRDILKYSQSGQERFLVESRMALAINPTLIGISGNGGDMDMDSIEPHRLLTSVAGILDSTLEEQSVELLRALSVIAYVRGFHADASRTEPNAGYPSYDYVEQEASYIMEHFDQIEPLIPELRARRSYDRETIELLLSSPSPTLAEGML